MRVETLETQHVGKRKIPIFSIDISAKNEIATGGGDGKVVVWSTGQVFQQHTGAVLCVRFSIKGTFLASASDDKAVNIYRKENQFSFAKKLNHHKSDVVGLGWTHDHLLSAGCDGIINFYETRSFGLTKKIRETLFLKGLAIDPLCKQFCVQYDKGIQMYNINGQLMAKNEEIFQGNVIESFFSRMSFSRDSKFLAVGLSFNNKANSVEILDMNLKRMYSLLGHVAPTEVVAFNPNVFKKDERYYVIAVASQDRSVSLWCSCNHRPFLLLKNVVEAPVLDMCWSKQGDVLMMCTYDGEVKRLQFRKDELGKVCKMEDDSNLPLTYEYYELGRDPEQPETESAAKCSEESERDLGKTANAFEQAHRCSTVSKDPGVCSQKDHMKGESVAAEITRPVKKIKPFLIAPLEEKDGVVVSEREGVLFIFKSIRRQELSKREPRDFVKVVNEHRVEYSAERGELRVFRGEYEYFCAKGIVSHVCVGKDYMGLVSASENRDKIRVLDLEACTLAMPVLYSCGVAVIDTMECLFLIVETTGDFRVLDLKARKKICAGVLPFNGNVNVNLCRKYFLVADCDGQLYFYSRKMDVWFRKCDEYESVHTEKTDTAELGDNTIEEVNYRFLVAREAGCLKDMQRHARRLFRLVANLDSMDDLLENKMCDVVVSLVRVGSKDLAKRLLNSLCRNYALHYFVYDMQRTIRDLELSGEGS